MEAAALALTSVGQDATGLLQALELLMDALQKQCHHDTLFQHTLPEPTGKKKFAMGAKKLQMPGIHISIYFNAS